eukprot:m.13903 g.13903  ORF g.13903 m.13903 type:complete len:431 (-) comp4952_c0_seq1:200-1492(-)
MSSHTFLVSLVLTLGMSVCSYQPKFPPEYSLQASTIAMACNYSGALSPNVSKYGIVDIDWSNMKEVWANDKPMDAEQMLTTQAILLKNYSCPSSCPAPQGCSTRGQCRSKKVWVYRNPVKALPWFGSVRKILEDPAYEDFFIKFAGTPDKNGSIPGVHVPTCDSNFNPPRCSSFYHDQSQTPQYPTGSLLDGSCYQPCDCGNNTPCGEYVFDHRNPKVRQWILQEFIGGVNGLGNPNVDGFLLDDAWIPDHGKNDSIPGGPTEYEKHAVQDMGLSQQDVYDLFVGWNQTRAEIYEAVTAAGGWVWGISGYRSVNRDNCVREMQSMCSNTSNVLSMPTIFYRSGNMSDVMGDIGVFLTARGPHAWLGYGWRSTCNAPIDAPDVLFKDYQLGEPTEVCQETGNNTGVFVRHWSNAIVSIDCNTYEGKIIENK